MSLGEAKKRKSDGRGRFLSPVLRAEVRQKGSGCWLCVCKGWRDCRGAALEAKSHPCRGEGKQMSLVVSGMREIRKVKSKPVGDSLRHKHSRAGVRGLFFMGCEGFFHSLVSPHGSTGSQCGMAHVMWL